MKNNLVKMCNIPDEKIKVIYNGININDYPLDSMKVRKNYVIMLGPLTENKGIYHFIKLAQVHKNKNLKFIATGQPGKYSYSKDVIFTNYISHSTLTSLLSNAKAVVLPSVWSEPSSMVPLEAMACGTPTIAYDRGGNAELIEHGKTGFVVPFNDIEALAYYIDLLNKDDELVQKMGCNGIKRIREFYNVDRMVLEYNSTINKIINKNK